MDEWWGPGLNGMFANPALDPGHPGLLQRGRRESYTVRVPGCA
jgi:hypothetical protein